MFRALFVFHRWFGIAGGLMVLVWYGSGIGLHWRALPRILTPDEQRQLAGAPLDLAEARLDFADVLARADAGDLREIQLRRAGSRIVYELRDAGGTVRVLDARSGEPLTPVTDQIARNVASVYRPDARVRESVLLTEGDRFSSNLPMPLYRVTFDDAQGTSVYVSQRSGAVLARTRTAERLYFTYASIPHVLSFNTPFFRRHETLRFAALFVLNAAALVIALTGLTVFLMMLRRHGFLRGLGVRQPALRRWHYVAGAAIALSTLLFVMTGFFLVLDGGTPPESVLARPADVRRLLSALPAAQTLRPVAEVWAVHAKRARVGLRSVTLRSVLGRPLYVFQDTDGRQSAMTADSGEPFAVDQKWLQSTAGAYLRHARRLGPAELITEYDSYYYARDNRFPPLPAYRAAAADDAQTVLYFSLATGEVVGRTDRAFRMRRWLVTAFHTWDFPFLLNRPRLRDAVVLSQIGGGLVLTVTGMYLGATHLLLWGRQRRHKSTKA